jgi:hypothetical protein
MTLASELELRPLVAHCHLGLGRLYRRTGKPEQAQEHLTTAPDTRLAAQSLHPYLIEAFDELGYPPPRNAMECGLQMVGMSRRLEVHDPAGAPYRSHAL